MSAGDGLHTFSAWEAVTPFFCTGMTPWNRETPVSSKIPFADGIKAPIIGFGLFPALLMPSHPSADKPVKGLFPFLPFIFVFQLLCGMMYGYLMTEYAERFYLAGSELFFYIAAVLFGLNSHFSFLPSQLIYKNTNSWAENLQRAEYLAPTPKQVHSPWMKAFMLTDLGKTSFRDMRHKNFL